MYAYLAFLEQTYFISLLPRYSGSIDRQAAGSRKLFLFDSGIAGILWKSSEGQLFEQSVFQNLRSDYALAFYNRNEGKEIDFIVDKKIALEVKTTASQRDITTLQLRANSIRIPDYFVITIQYLDKEKIVVVTDM